MQIASRVRSCGLLAVFALLIVAAMPAQAQPTFAKTFTPDTIGVGNVSALVFEIDNGSGTPVTDLAFTDILPAGVTIATPSVVTTDCADTVVSAPAGGGTITLSDGEVPAFTTCTISVDVTSSTLGTHMNVSGDLTSNVGNSGPAVDDLNVVATYPGFTKAFAPSTIDFGERSTLTLTIDNSANPGVITGVTFTDFLPGGLVIASPANASTDCLGATLTAQAGTSTVSILGGALLANTTCTVTVDVAGSAIGSFDNRTEVFFSPGGPSRSAGLATANLTVNLDPNLHIIKDFLDDPVAPGNTVTLEFTLRNQNPSNSATSVTFTDDLDATLSGLVATGLPMNDVCGAGSVLSGTGLLTLTGGSIPARDSCTFSVTLQVPAGAASGAYPNTTTTVSAMVGGSPVSGNQATETLYVSPIPVLTKTFLTNPAGAGDTITIEFTITNSSTVSSATDLAFLDNLSTFLSGVVYTSGFQSNICGAGSGLSLFVASGQDFLNFFGGNLGPGASCTFTADLLLPAGGAPGSFVNTTTDITGTIGGTPVTGPPATDTLEVVVGPLLTKQFTNDPVMPGGTVTLEFTLTQDVGSPSAATAIAFTDDLNAALAGLSAIGLPMNDVCGAGSQISGTTNLSFTGGTLAPGASCTFSVTLQVPVAALPGDYTNTTGSVTANVSGIPTTRLGGQDTLTVGGVLFTKEFIDDPLIPGGTGTLRFTIDNQSAADATALFFTDSLTSALSGLNATTLPTTPCGAGSTISGTTSLIFTGGNLVAGTQCVFDVTVMVPAAAADGAYINTTSNLTGTLGGSMVTLPPASDTLEVSSQLLQLAKSFTDDPVAPGDLVTLEFTLTNLDSVNAASAIAFTDDLAAALTGLAAVGLPANNVCNGAGTISGTTNLSFTGGALAAGASCTFSVSLQVPGGAATGIYTNTTSVVTGTITGLPVEGSAASDDLNISVITFSKAFDGPTVATGTAVLSFTIENLGSSPVNGLTFSDDLSTAIPGMVATGLPLSNVCGAGSQISGTSVLSLTGGTLGAGASCTINVTVQVPAGVGAGSYLNTSGGLFQSGLQVADPASANLVIDPPPSFSKSFDGPTVATGTTVLTFTIQNNSTRPIDGLSFTDDLDASLPGMTPVGLPLSNICGAGSLISGTSLLSFTGGSVAGSGSCSFDVTLQIPVGVTPSTFPNSTSNLLRNGSVLSPPANAILTIDPPPTFTKAFDGPTTATGTALLTFTIQNNSTRALSGLSFTDNLDATIPGMTASGLPQSDVCGTGSLVSGTSVVSVTGGNIAGSGSCSFGVTVQVPAGVTASSYLNTTGNLLQNGRPLSPPATANLIIEPPPLFSKAFVPDIIVIDAGSTLTFTVDNTANTLAASNLAFSDNLPAGVEVAAPANATSTCGGTVTAASGGAAISLSGGTVAAGATCTVSVDVLGTAIGTHVNLSGDLTSSSGNSGTATANLEVLAPLLISKRFIPGAVLAGQTARLEYTLDNPSALLIDNIAFTDDLDAVLAGLVATGLPQSDICGLGSMIDGTSLLTFTGGSLAAGTTCVFTVDIVIPDSAVPGTYPSTTSDPTADAGGEPIVGAAGLADLVVQANVLDIPTLDEWALLLLISLLALVAVGRMRF